MLFDHNGIKLEIKNRKISGKLLEIWKLNCILLNQIKELQMEKIILALAKLFGLKFLVALNMLVNKMKIKALYNSIKKEKTKLAFGYF